MAGGFPVVGGFRWQIFQRSKGHDTTGEHLLSDPRKSLLLQLPGRLRPFLGAVKVGERKGIRVLVRPLPKRRHVEAEKLAEAALGIHDLTVHLVGGHIHKSRRQIGQQRLEAQALFQFRGRVGVFRAHRIIRM